MVSEKPLVSYGLICYRQERYIEQAVESALAQTYEPMQIVISDDASPDGTFGKIQRLVDAYTGPHRIVLNRNPSNLGLTANVNRVVELAEGELIVVAAGDDYSLPERTAVTVDKWLREGRPRGSICTGYRNMNADGELWSEAPPPLPPSPTRLADWFRDPFPLVNGAAHAFHPDLYRVFGPLKAGRWSEDMPLAMRALALDGVFFTPEPMVWYRRHDENLAAYVEQRTTLSQAMAKEHARYRRRADVVAQMLEDMEHPAFEAKWGVRPMRQARKACRRALRHREVMSEWLAAGEGPVSWKLIAKAWAWPPMVATGARLTVRRLCPGLHKRLLARNKIRWEQEPETSTEP